MKTLLNSIKLDEAKSALALLRQYPTIVIMDTEQVCWEDSLVTRAQGQGPAREVIQLAAITVDTQSFVELSAFEIMVKPVFYPELSPFCVELTGITQDRVLREGKSFTDGYTAWVDYVAGQNVLVYRADEDVMRENLAMHNDSRVVPQYLKCRAMLEACGIDMTGINSGKIAQAFGSSKKYREHDALADVRSMGEGWALLAQTVQSMSAKGQA